MDDNKERERIKKLAIVLSILAIITVIVLEAYFVMTNTFSLNVVLVSSPFALLLVLSVPALMYFWKGPIK